VEKQLIRLQQVQAAVGLSRSEIYRLIRLGRFPKSVPLGERIVAWESDVVQAWIHSRIAARDQSESGARARALLRAKAA
jgi:prophage regulatory protein